MHSFKSLSLDKIYLQFFVVAFDTNITSCLQSRRQWKIRAACACPKRMTRIAERRGADITFLWNMPHIVQRVQREGCAPMQKPISKAAEDCAAQCSHYPQLVSRLHVSCFPKFWWSKARKTGNGRTHLKLSGHRYARGSLKEYHLPRLQDLLGCDICGCVFVRLTHHKKIHSHWEEYIHREITFGTWSQKQRHSCKMLPCKSPTDASYPTDRTQDQTLSSFLPPHRPPLITSTFCFFFLLLKALGKVSHLVKLLRA